MNKKSLLTRAHITLARSARARQTIAAVLMLFAVPSAWASDDFYYLDGEWHIKSSTGWDEFCENLKYASNNGYSGQTVCLDSDISVTTMACISSEYSFKGTFDGQGHTLTVNYSSSSSLYIASTAPFRFTSGDVTIQNLHVSGSIYTNAKYAAGFIAQGEGNSIVIRNCVSSVEINSGVNGDGTHAGFVAISNVNSSTRFEGCLFNGKLLGTNTACCGGYVGWRSKGEVCFQDCLFAPAEYTVSDSGSEIFCRNFRQGTDPINRAYFTKRLGGTNSNQGLQLCRISQGIHTTLSLNGEGTYYNVPGITFYGSAQSGQGVKYGGAIYGGLNERIKMNIGLFVGDVWILKNYYANNATLLGQRNPFTVCPQGDGVVIDANIVGNPSNRGIGTEDNPCEINSEKAFNQLRELVSRGDVTEFTYFKQTADISISNGYFEPIGTKDHPFMSNYDGNGKTISHLTVNSGTPHTGCFGHVEGRISDDPDACAYAEIHDLNFEYCSVMTGSSTQYGGMVAGYCGSGARIIGCSVISCTVMDADTRYGGKETLGGLVGYTIADKSTLIKGNFVIDTYVNIGVVCGGLIGKAENLSNICENFVLDASIVAVRENSKKREGGLIGDAGGVYDENSYYSNYYRSMNYSQTAVYGRSDNTGEAHVSIVSGIPEEAEVSGNIAASYNGTNYYAQGSTITVTLPSTSDKAFVSVSGTDDYTISDNMLTFTIGSMDITVSTRSVGGSCGDNAKWTLAKDNQGNYTRLTISGSGDIYNYGYTTVNNLWRTDAPWGWDLTSVTIGNDITGIGDYAFIGCQQLSELSLGNGVKSIGANAFDHCDGLTWVTLPANVSTLAAGAFKNSVNLQTVYIQKSDGLVSITGVSAFDGCHSSLVLVAPTPALAIQYKTASYWSNYAARLRVGFGNYLFSATDEGGTAAYAIANATDLNNLSAAVNTNQGYASTGKTFRQTADIALSGNFTPIAYYDAYNFAGTYDGGGHFISGLSISGNNTYNGLFGIVSGGTVRSVILMNPRVTATDSNTGVLIGRIDNQGSAINCYAYGTGNLIGSTGKATVTNVARARKVTFNDGITATPDASDIANGFVYSDESYYREGIELTLNAPEGYDVIFSYTAGNTTTKLEGSTLTVPAADISVNLVNLSIKKWAGSGTSEDPFMIEYVSQLDSLAQRVNGGTDFAGIYFKLGKDISYHTEGLSDTESNFTAIGGHKKYFKGHFKGDNHKVSGIRIYKDGTDFEDFYQGLFGLIGPGASVSGVFLSDARITGYQRVGGIVGENQGGTVSNCHVLSDVTIHAVKNMSTYHGGNVGSNSHGGIVTNCTGAATVTCADGLSYCQYYGGIVGQNQDATVTNCLYTGTTVSANAYVGAIIGLNSGASSKVEDCYYTMENATGGNGDTDCAIGSLSEGTPDPEHVMYIDFEPAPEALATRLAPQDNEDNNFFVTLMARRAAILKAAVPQYDASVNLTLRGRTLNRDGKWHTICLPFDVVLEGSPLEGAEAHELINANITGTTLNLVFSNPVEKLVAGTPYIIRLSNAENSARVEKAALELTDPTFDNVHIDDTDRSFDNAEEGNLRVRFVGSYKMTNFDNALKSTLLMNGADSPNYPAVGTNVGAFRAYFMIGDGENEGTVSITDFNIKLGDDDYTGIVDNASERGTDRQASRKVIFRNDVDAEANSHLSPLTPHLSDWYDLNGRKLRSASPLGSSKNGKPSRSGVYIQK